MRNLTDKLKELFNDKHLQEVWATFIMDVLNKEALSRVYSGKDVSALKEARLILEKSFMKLNEKFETKKSRKSRSVV